VLRHVEMHEEQARALYLRHSYPGLLDFEDVCRQVFGGVYGKDAVYNVKNKIWRFPNGGTLELGQLADMQNLNKYQGRSFSLVFVDELAQYPTPVLIDQLRGSLRAVKGVPTRMVVAANPGGVGHAWISARYVIGKPRWRRFDVDGQSWVYAPSIFTDNPHLDFDDYRRQLESATSTDPELRKAWLTGDWNIARGAFFAGVLGEKNKVEEWEPRRYWNFHLYLGHDYGSSAPSVTYIVARSLGGRGPDGRFYPAGSILLLDELATAERHDPSQGLGYTIPHLAEMITELAQKWGIRRPSGVADDACFARHGHLAGSIADEFRQAGVYWRRARKGNRVAGWATLRRMMEDAGKPDRAGFYVSTRCRYWWETVPSLPRDPRRPEDVDTRAPDHAADASRYAVVWERPVVLLQRVVGV
jgi:hypothetical protein